ncbi:hypothetical protein Q9966_016678 [Columba livia]|nr:hypothetical protein Q9966_016678 [Columba livia]
MAPTIQTQAQREEPGHRPSSHRTLPERSGVVCRVKFCNSLPDIPFDPKFITYPFDQSRFVQYKGDVAGEAAQTRFADGAGSGGDHRPHQPRHLSHRPQRAAGPGGREAAGGGNPGAHQLQKVAATRQSGAVDAQDRVHLHRVQPLRGLQRETRGQNRRFGETTIHRGGDYKDRDSQIAAIEKTFEDAQKAITQHYRQTARHPRRGHARVPRLQDVDQPVCPSDLRLGPGAQGHEWGGGARDDVPGHDPGNDGRGGEPVRGLFPAGGGDAAQAQARPGGGRGLRARGRV